jgi:branched-subunit amino acid aminotransferase/4-amino-4-deoxychorismate lyase
VRERIILVDDLRRAERIFLTNAVRGRYEVRLVGFRLVG